MARKVVFLTGCAGFIGFHLAKKLGERGDKVIGFDNFNDYYDPALKRAREKVLQESGIEIVEGDLCDTATIKKLFDCHGFTHVLHMAAQAGVRYSLKNPKAYLHSNVEGFLSLLEICKENKQVPIVYASSSSVYGCNQKIPFSIEDKADLPANLYGATKKMNELMAYAYHHLYGMPLTALRFFTVYGPWGRPDMAYFLFTKALFEGKKIPLFNQGKMQRDFTFIDDIVQGALKALDHAFAFEIFNLGNCSPEPIDRFIHILEEATGKKAAFDLLPMQEGDMEVTFADIAHSREKLHFQPTTSLEIGLPQFVDWYRSFYGKN